MASRDRIAFRWEDLSRRERVLLGWFIVGVIAPNPSRGFWWLLRDISELALDQGVVDEILLNTNYGYPVAVLDAFVDESGDTLAALALDALGRATRES